ILLSEELLLPPPTQPVTNKVTQSEITTSKRLIGGPFPGNKCLTPSPSPNPMPSTPEHARRRPENASTRPLAGTPPPPTHPPRSPSGRRLVPDRWTPQVASRSK